MREPMDCTRGLTTAWTKVWDTLRLEPGTVEALSAGYFTWNICPECHPGTLDS